MKEELIDPDRPDETEKAEIPAPDAAGVAAEKIDEQKLESSKVENEMEVYHPHSGHQSKTFKGYLFEFLMLFLAITGGFITENLRETYVEHHKEKQYMVTMVKDLQADSAALVRIVERNIQQEKGIDSLLVFMESSGKQMDGRKLYLFVNNYLNSYVCFSANTMTISQLKYSGALRLISNKAVVDSVVNYYYVNESHLEQSKYNLLFLQKIIEIEMQDMNFSYFRKRQFQPVENTPKMRELYNRSIVFLSALSCELEWLKEVKLQNTALLGFLRKEYSLH